MRANKQAPSSSDFWVAYILGAYQGRVDLDNDPYAEEHDGGIGGRGDAGPYALVYRETVRDVIRDPWAGVTTSETDAWALTAVHEIAHQFRLQDNLSDGPLMSYVAMGTADTQAELDALQFSGTGLRKIAAVDLYGRN
ncbi:MAG: hypothetical protein HYV63_02325 [Candidatus Schekmanbacteria bacterium]|nr:hypothetical protein [Candidatus Schekmanbacteria bacterium]